MDADQMHTVTLFAVALDKMNRAAKADQPVTLDAAEAGAMVSTVRTLTSGIQSARGTQEATNG